MRCLPILAVLLHLASAAHAEEPYPAGRSARQLGGLTYEMLVPSEDQAKKNEGYSLLVILHGAGGTATGMVGVGQPFLDSGFITCAPKSTGSTWSTPDLAVVRQITQHLIDLYDVAIHRRHAMGFSNGGWNLAPVAFDDKLHFRTATWIAAGFNGGKVPKWASREMGCIALAGANDANRAAAEKTPDLLEKKVKFADCRIQPGIGHEFTRELVPYWHYVMEVMEGRFTPGRQASFEWTDDLAAARSTMEVRKRGGFVYVYDENATEKERALTRQLQDVALLDPMVAHFGLQLIAVKLEKARAADLVAEARIKKMPALVVFRPGGAKVAKVLAGTVKAKAVAGALRSVAKDKSMPR